MEFSAFDNRQDNIYRDQLTGAFNRELLFVSLNEAMADGRTSGKPFSLCIIDLDFFKSINDAYGHFRGDQALREFSQRVQSLIRESDALFRFGGDEFALLLMNSTKEQAMITADRILEHFLVELISGDPPIRLSLSMGIATCPDDGVDTDTLFQVADRHTYHAKHCGRGLAVGEYNPALWKREGAHRLIERELAFSNLKVFIERLKLTKRGVLSIIGPSGTGRTSFLKEVRQLTKMLNYQTLEYPQVFGEKLHGDKLGRPGVDVGEMGGISWADNIKHYVRSCIDGDNCEGVILFIDNLSRIKCINYDDIQELINDELFTGLSLVYTALPESDRRIFFPEPAAHETIYLMPLSPPGLHIMLRNVLRWEPPVLFIDWLYRETLGNPKLVKEALRVLMKRDILKHGIEHEWELHPGYMDIPLRSLLACKAKKSLGNLPAALNEFFGREREIEEILRLLTRSRIVTLRGPGGIGKTRLALQVAQTSLGDFQDGVFFVPLATINKPEWVIPAIAKVMHIQENSGQPVKEALEESLKTKERLLIFDNFEQVTEAAVALVDLLKAAPRLKIMATSREALHISGEHLYDVPPLQLPAPNEVVSVEASLRHPAIALFVNRAQAMHSEFMISQDNVALISEICRRLEGIPLAIELAAASLSHLSPNEMLSQEGTRLDWLIDGPYDLPKRHQTLRATLEWSYDLLTPEEKCLFARLGVFTGGFTQDAVSRVIGSCERLKSQEQIYLYSLIGKSLLQKIPGSDGSCGARFQMLETIREYALELLNQQGDSTLYQQRHALYYRDLVGEAVRKFLGPQQHEWMLTIESEHANLRAALEWAEQVEEPDLLLELAVTISAFWEAAGYWSEARQRIKRVLGQLPKDWVCPRVAYLYHWAGWFASLQGSFDEALEKLNASMELFKGFDMTLGMAMVNHRLGWTMYLKGQFRLAKELWDESLMLYRAAKESSGIATVLRDLGRAEYFFGDYARSEVLCWESLALSREMEYPKGIARALHWLGEIARSKGDYEQSQELFQESISYFQALGDRFEVANTTFSLAELCRSRGDMEQALRLFQYHLKLSCELGYRPGYAYALLEIGEIARCQGNVEQALANYRQCLEILDSIGEYGRMAWVYRDMAEVAQTMGDFPLAKTLYQESLGMLREDGHVMLIALSLGGLAGVERALGNPVRAARLLGAAESRLESTRPQIAQDDLKDYDDRVEAIWRDLGEAAFAVAMNEGRAVPLKKAMSYALEEEPLELNGSSGE